MRRVGSFEVGNQFLSKQRHTNTKLFEHVIGILGIQQFSYQVQDDVQ